VARLTAYDRPTMRVRSAPLILSVVAIAGLAATGTASAAAVPPPAPSKQVVGEPAPASASPVLSQVIGTWTSMTWTLYSHVDREYPATGRYQFDCVGMTNYFLGLGAPKANDELRTRERIGAHYVPSPTRVAAFLRWVRTKGSARWWTAVTRGARIRPGDLIAIPPAKGSKEPGHAVIAAGPPKALADGSFALLVYDSTAQPAHGPFDTRNTDPRNAVMAGTTRHSGLGRGTIQILVDAKGRAQHMRWFVTGYRYGGPLEIGRPLQHARG